MDAEILIGQGAATLIVAVATTAVTGLIKLPLKRLAERAACRERLTRFITFLPLAVALGLTFLARAVLPGSGEWRDGVLPIWLRSASLSLAIYAFVEKFAPGALPMTEKEIRENREALEKAQALLGAETGDEGAAACAEGVGKTAREDDPHAADGGEKTAAGDGETLPEERGGETDGSDERAAEEGGAAAENPTGGD